MNKNLIEKIAPQLTELMIKKMEISRRLFAS